jgi:citrate lyase beta subunit
MKYLKLGATLYMPSTRTDLAEVGNGLKFKNIRTIVYCTEDSIREEDLPSALANLKKTLPRLESGSLYRFIRPRNPEVLKILLSMPCINRITGFVLPKSGSGSLSSFLPLLESHENFEIMPTLETKIALDLFELYRLRDFLLNSTVCHRILALRIGAMDLLNILNIRRDINKTIYDTPLRHAVDQLITVFRPAKFDLAAPPYEGLENPGVLADELKEDIGRGLFAKTAIHPSQADIIQSAYMVGSEELEMAKSIVNPDNPPVFRFGGRMCEKAVHTEWAKNVLERASLYGSCVYASPPIYDYRLENENWQKMKTSN